MTDEHSSSSLTSFLVSASRPLFTAATQSPFLGAAGDGTLSKAKLSEWLRQDRLYAQAYIGFIGSLLANVKLPVQHITFAQHGTSVRWRIAHILRASLDNIFRELKFFEDTAEKCGLDLQVDSAKPSCGIVEATADYVELFERFSSRSGHDYISDSNQVLLNGLIVLWTTEKCYLEAWRFAASHSDASKAPASDADDGALRNHFIPNWTCQEFADFVEQLEQLVNELMDDIGMNLTQDVQDELKQLWDEVLEIEKRFWPEL